MQLGIFPGDGGAGFDLRPGNFGVLAAAFAALGDEIVDSALAVLIAGIPVLHGGIFDLRVIESDQLDNRGVQLVFVANRRGAAFEIAHVGAFFGDDQSALELARFRGIDAEVGGKLHRAADAFGHVDERAVGEDGGVESGEEIVGVGNHRAEIFLHEVGMLLHRFGEGAENHARFGELRFEGGGDGDAVENRVDGDAREHFLLFERNAELLVGAANFGIEFVEILQVRFLLGRGIIDDVLIVDRRILDVRPLRLGLGLLRATPSGEKPSGAIAA